MSQVNPVLQANPLQVNQGQIVEFGSHLVSKAQWIDNPAAISWLPQTFAWKMIALLIVTLIIAYLIQRQYRALKRTYLRQAWQRFNQIQRHGSDSDYAPLLKQLAHQHWPEKKIGSMSNDDFADFIALTASKQITESQVKEIIEASYARQPEISHKTKLALTAWFEEVTC